VGTWKLSNTLSVLASEIDALISGSVSCNVPLAKISRWRIGGSADIVVQPSSVEDLIKLRSWINARNLPQVVIGATSNLLFSDEGLRAICIQIGSNFSSVSVKGNLISASSGLWVPSLARLAMTRGLSGISHICGIPGTLGGLVCMNGGSQRQGIGDVVVNVASIDKQGQSHVRTAAECEFGYRKSIFQSNEEIITEVTLELSPDADRKKLRREMLGIMSNRRRKFPQKLPNCGSVFVSNPSMYQNYGTPGALIESLGFKGMSIGGAQVSPQHANFIVNTGGGTSVDTLALITQVRNAIFLKTGYEIEVEARYVTPDGRLVPAVSDLSFT